MYETRIALHYPTGRVHVETLSTWDPIDIGSQFQLYGHTWTAVGLTTPRTRYDDSPKRLVCEIAGVARAA